MSATSVGESDLDARFKEAISTLGTAIPGDYVMFDSDNRQAALEVTDVETRSDGNRTLHIRGSRGGEYEIAEKYNNDGSPAFTTGQVSANDLRFATAEEIHDHIEQQGGIQPDELSEGEDPENVAEELVTELRDRDPESGEPQSVGDLRREGPPAGEPWPAPPADGAQPHDADDLMAELSDDPSTSYESYLDRSDIAGSEADDSILGTFGTDEPWTFIDELLAMGADVPKTVNNWHLVDYGLVTDSALDVTRQAAWYNVETDSLVALAGLHNEGEGENKWYVFHAEDANDIGGQDIQPAYTGDLDGAVEEVNDTLYSSFSGDTADVTIVENTRTRRAVIWDALTDTEVLRRLAAARNADPYGIRSYVAETDAPQFIQDTDDALIALASRVNSSRTGVKDRWDDFIEGSNKVLLEDIRNWVVGYDFQALGRNVRAIIISAAAGVRKRFTGVAVAPVISYTELGVDVQALYRGRDAGESRRTIDPRVFAETPVTDDEGEPVTDDEGEPVTERSVQGYITDPLLNRIGLEYYQLVHLADWLDANEWVFTIPDPWEEDSEVSFSFGRPSTGDGKGSARESAQERGRRFADRIRSGGSGQPTLQRPEEIDADAMDGLMLKYSDNEPKQLYVGHLAILSHAARRYDDEDFEATGELKGPDRQKIGESRADNELRDAYQEHGFSSGDFDLDVLVDALHRWQQQGRDLEDALDEALDEHGNVAVRSDTFDDVVFGGSAAQPEPESGEQEIDRSQPSEGSAAEPASGLSESESDRAKTLVERLERDMTVVGDLTDDDIELLRQADREADFVPESVMVDIENRATGRKQTKGQMTTDFGDAEVSDLVGQLNKSGTTDTVSDMNPDERTESVEDYYDDEEFLPPEERAEQRSFEERVEE